jgi:hypothetical protein
VVRRDELRKLHPGKSEAWYTGWVLADMDIRQIDEEKRLARERAADSRKP